MQSILKFEWIYSCDNQINFIVVENCGIHLYKIEEKLLIREYKFFLINISFSWFDVRTL